LSHLLSEYLDGALDPREKEKLEEYLSAHPEAEKELRDLRQIKHLVAAKERIAPDPYFWSRLSAHIESDAEEEQNLLPFPRKHVPLASAMAILAFVAVGLTIFLQREPILDYLSRQSQAVKEVYESNILKGAVFPLFANIDNDRVLQYALFGTLPLDAKAETALRVDEKSEQGYHIEVGMTADRLPPPVTVKDMYKEVLPTKEQRAQIDMVLDDARARIAKGAFYSENNALAVDPELTKLNRVVLTNIAAALAPIQRERFDRFLTKKNASYVLAEGRIPHEAERKHFPRAFDKRKGGHEFVVMTEDSTIVTHLSLNVDSLLQSVLPAAPVVATELSARLEHLMKARFEHNVAARVRSVVPEAPVRTTGEEDFFRVEVSPRIFTDAESMHVWVTPRLKKEKMFRFEYRVQSGGVRVESGSDFEMEFNVGQMDSLMRALTREQLRNSEQFRKADSVFRSRTRVYSRPGRIRSADTTERE
jgi:hypothetical protein